MPNASSVSINLSWVSRKMGRKQADEGRAMVWTFLHARPIPNQMSPLHWLSHLTLPSSSFFKPHLPTVPKAEASKYTALRWPVCMQHLGKNTYTAIPKAGLFFGGGWGGKNHTHVKYRLLKERRTKEIHVTILRYPADLSLCGNAT